MSRIPPIQAAILAIVLGLAGPGTIVGAQDPASEDPTGAVPEIAEVQTQIRLLTDQQAENELNAEDTTRLQLLRGTLTSLQAAAKSVELGAQYREKEAQAPVELEAIRAELARPPEVLQPQVPPGATLDDLDGALRTAQSELDTARALLREIEAALAQRETAIDETREQQATLQHDLLEIDAQLGALPLPDESPALTDARSMKLNADREATVRQIELLTQERENIEARQELLPLRRDRMIRRVNQLAALEAAWQTLVDDARAQDIRRNREEAARTASVAHPVVRELARANVVLADRRDQLRPNNERAQRDLVNLSPDPETLRRQSDRLQQKVDVVGMTSTVGLMLRRSRDELPDTRLTATTIRQRRSLMAEIEYERLEYEDDRAELVTGQEKVIREFMAGLDPRPPDAELQLIEQEIRDLVRLRIEYFDALDDDLSTYFNRLQALNEAEQQIVDLTDELTSYIDRHILWIQSTRPLSSGDLKAAGDALAWMFGPDWAGLAANLRVEAQLHWAVVVVTAIFILALLALRRRLGLKIRSIGGSLTVPEEATFGQLLVVTLFTAMRAAVWPAVMWFIGGLMRLATPDGDIELGLAVSDAFRDNAAFLFILMLAYETCLPLGLGEAHFGWRPRNVRVARRQVGWLTIVVVCFGLPVRITSHQSNDAFESSLGRLSFIVAVVALSYFVHGLLNPRSGIMRDYLAQHSSSWANRLRYIWYPAAVITPLALAAASALGYHYTAISICREVLDSAAYVVVVVFMYYLALRWIQMGKRKMALDQARKRRAAYEERAARGEEAGEAPPAAVKGAQFDVSQVSTQALQMLRAAVLFMLLIGWFAIWAESIPAIGFLERVELWQGVELSASEAAAAGFAPAVPGEPLYDMVTLQDLLWAMVLTVLTMIVAKNIPGLLEITVLQHLPLERGSQFAISTIVRYAITIVGIAVAFRVIGVTWAKVQWLAAALTVGLGFGLNEIFGNFISGLIILFERPIRVGDTVTVGTTTGTVNQIKIRSTTLVDWDRKELVIPNKVFVTDTIVNWTLSSQLLRLVFPVAIEHGADTVAAERVLLEAANGNVNVADDPAPSVMFKNVGEQGLEIDLRLFIPHIDHLVGVKHDVYNRIVDGFRNAGIRFFNFSHRDIEVKAMSGTPIKLADTREHELKGSG